MNILLERGTEPMVIGSKSVGMKIQDGGGTIHTFCFHATRACQCAEPFASDNRSIEGKSLAARRNRV
jgi:hypothetical protein